MEGGGDHRDARRPMNSFFLFCKRHRSIIRNKLDNVDNRNISRILGELWANFDPLKKKEYTAIAKEYKDAFFKANPDYKWHNNDKTHLMSPNNNSLNPELIDTDRNLEKMECYRESPVHHTNMDILFMAIQQTNKESDLDEQNENNIAPAAGESSLLSQKSTTVKELIENEDEDMEYTTQQWTCKNEMSCIDTPSKFPEYPAKDASPSTSSPTHPIKDGNESDGSKSHQSDASLDVSWTKNNGFDNNRQNDCTFREIHMPTRKSKRANKGAIYKNLIATGVLPAARERLAEMQTIYNINSDDGSEIKEIQCHPQPIRRIKRTASESDTHFDKRYKTGDFDLDAKIATLPACSMDVLEKNRKNATKPKSSPENLRRPSGGSNTNVMKTDMLTVPPRRKRCPPSSPIKGCRKRKPSKASIVRIVPLPQEYKQSLQSFMKKPCTLSYFHPTMKSYQDLVKKSETSSTDQASSASDESFELKTCIAIEEESCTNKDEEVITTNVPTITASILPTTTLAESGNYEEFIKEKTILHSTPVKADCEPVSMVSNATSFVTPSSMSNIYQASVSSEDLSMKSPPVTNVLIQGTATRTSNIPLAAIAPSTVVISEPMQNPASMELGPTSGLHVSGELKVKLGSQSPKQSNLGENPEFKIWISNLAEAAERTEQISVC